MKRILYNLRGARLLVESSGCSTASARLPVVNATNIQLCSLHESPLHPPLQIFRLLGALPTASADCCSA
eukprot:6471550-Amphidinium_carterae.4